MYYANCEWYVDMGEHNKPLCKRNSLRPAKCSECPVYIRSIEAENAKLREQVERLQPKDCEGNVLDIADTVSMLRSEYDGDHEWDDVVVELVLTKWGGDRWIVRGSRGEAWACDCSKTGYDEGAYEDSDDAEPIANPTLMECENAKLRELFYEAWEWMQRARYDRSIRANEMDEIGVKAVKLGFPNYELGIEV